MKSTNKNSDRATKKRKRKTDIDENDTRSLEEKKIDDVTDKLNEKDELREVGELLAETEYTDHQPKQINMYMRKHFNGFFDATR